MKRALILAVLAFVFAGQISLPAAAAEGSNLASMAGTWSGEGFVRQRSFDEKQRVKCKIRVTLAGADRTKINGRCATAARSHKVAMEITTSGSGNRVSSVGSVSGSAQPFVFNGRRNRTGFTLYLAEPIKQNGRTITSRTSILLPDRATLSISQIVQDMVSGQKIDAMRITLRR